MVIKPKNFQDNEAWLCVGVFVAGPSLGGGQPVRRPEAHDAKGPISIYVIYIILSI